jgi:hypothetical protein
VIVAVPLATPVTTPLAVTVAMDVLLLVHPTIRPFNVFPAASLVVAVNVTLCPTIVDALAGETVTLATGTARTVTVAEPCFPSTDAMITAVPGATPETTPVVETVAIAEELLVQITVRPVSA